MATATVGRADIEKVVRKVLKQERDENDRTTVRAIQRVSSLLTEQVIPNLPDNTGAAEADDESGPPADSDEEHGAFPGSKVFASRSAHAADDIADDGNPSDDDQTAEVPEQVTEAFAALYRSLSPEQAEALSEFFKAVSEELGQSDDEHEDEDEEAGAEPEANPRLH